MHSSIIYQFPTSQVANRFLNSLKHWSVADVEAKLFSGDKVRVSYEYQTRGFDNTSSELDDHAASYGGHEVSE